MRVAAFIGGSAYIMIPFLMLIADRSFGTIVIAGITFFCGLYLLVFFLQEIGETTASRPFGDG